MLSHTSIEEYYHTVFALTQHHKWNIADIENLMPYELDIYSQLLIIHLKEEKAKHEEQMRRAGK